MQLRLKVVEDGLKSSLRSGICYEARSSPIGLSRSRSVNGAEVSSNTLSSGFAMRKSSAPVGRLSTMSGPSNTMLKYAKGVSKSFDGGRSSHEHGCRSKSFGDPCCNKSLREEIEQLSVSNTTDAEREFTGGKPSDPIDTVGDDTVSGVFYDILQKEVISLRKACHEKDQSLKDKDNSIEV